MLAHLKIKYFTYFEQCNTTFLSHITETAANLDNPRKLSKIEPFPVSIRTLFTADCKQREECSGSQSRPYFVQFKVDNFPWEL